MPWLEAAEAPRAVHVPSGLAHRAPSMIDLARLPGLPDGRVENRVLGYL